MNIRTLIRTPLQWVLLLACAVALGDFSFRVWNASPLAEYMVTRTVRPMTLAENSKSEKPKKHLYLRRTWYMTEVPVQAWLEVLGHDRLEVFVNGRSIGRSPMVSQSRIAAVMNDITPLLKVGRNSIAIHAPQLHLHRPPRVAVSGACEFADGSVTALGDAADWRAAAVYDRRGQYWFETDFSDEHWEQAEMADPENWRAQVNLPPGAITVPRRSQWILPADDLNGAAAFARSFDLPSSPRDGWLRVLSTGPYRVSVNGQLMADDHDDLAVKNPYRSVEQTYDISPLLKAGSNTISIFSATIGERPRIRADLEATTHNGVMVYVPTDHHWVSATGSIGDWQNSDLSTNAWRACEPGIGYLGAVPRSIERELVPINPPLGFWGARWVKYLCWIGLWGVLAAAGCAFTTRVLEHTNAEQRQVSDQLAYAALVPSTVLAFAGGIMTWDLAWTAHDVYQPLWLLGLVILVVAQWLLLVLIGTWKADGLATLLRWDSTQYHRWQLVGIGLCWVVVLGLAFWLRARDIVAQPIHHDEVTAYAFTLGVLDHGFPGGQVDPEIPFGWCATNELTYYFNALCTPFFDDPRLVVRVPSLLFSMASLVLIAYVGWRWFNGYVGFVAAVLYALSPQIIGMATFGRYLSQVQFFTLLTMYLTFEAVRGTGPLRIGMMWAAAVSFIAMYLSWEGTGMFGMGLALAVLFHRRRHLRWVFACPQFYAAVTVVALVVVAQNAHRVMQQTQRLWYGEGISSLTIKPMWRYPFFQYDYYLVNSAWTRDAMLPMLALAVACALTIAHRWRYHLRFSLICFLANAMFMAAFLPVRTNRYAYHLTEIFILITAAVMVAGSEKILQIVRSDLVLPAHRWYLRTVTVAATAIGIVLSCGWFVRTSEMTRFANASFDVRQLHCPDWEGPTRYLMNHLHDDDIVISIFPHSQDYMFAVHGMGDSMPRKADYWLESRLILQATLGDSQDLPLDRRSGAVMLYNLDQVKQLFAENKRIWYCTMRTSQSKINDSAVSKYFRENMDVVFEDFGTALMLRDANHRSAPIQLEEETAGWLASEFYLK